MSRWFSSNCTPCRPLLKSIQATVPWLGVYGNTDGSGATATTTNGKWPAPVEGNCNPDRYSAWHIQFGVIPGSPVSAGGGKVSSVRTRDVVGQADAYVSGVDPTYHETVTETLWEIDSGVITSAVTSTTTRSGLLASWSVPAGFGTTAATSLTPQTFHTFHFFDGVNNVDKSFETSITFSGAVHAPIDDAQGQASLSALKGLEWGQHSINGVISTLADPSTIPTYIFNQALNATSSPTQAPTHAGGQNLFWVCRRVAVSFSWDDMAGCVITAQTINSNTSAEGAVNCVSPEPPNFTNNCDKCYGGCSQRTVDSIADAIDQYDNVLYLEPPRFGQQYLVNNLVSCPSSVINLTQSNPCGCCIITCS